ncbi:MAG: hypothetical protein ACKVQA_10095 [Burkholderiales bacterium]
MEAKATEQLKAIPNKADVRYLDDFLRTYPKTDAADVAFTLRYNITRSSASIDEFNKFIEKYGETLPGYLAVDDVYQLYRQLDNVAGYVDFMKRYPNTPQAYLAKLSAQALTFEAAHKVAAFKNFAAPVKVQALDDFVLLNPDAPQVELASKLATLIAVEEELKARAKLARDVEARLKGRSESEITTVRADALRARANELATTFERTARSFDRFGEVSTNTIKTNGNARSLAIQLERAGEVVQVVYADQDAAARVRAEQRAQLILSKLEQVRRTLFESNERLIARLSEEFKETRRVLQEGFQALEGQLVNVNRGLALLGDNLQQINRSLYAINENVIQVVKGVERVNVNLGVINENVIQVARGIERVHASVERNNELTARMIDVVHADLVMVHDGIRSMHVDMNNGFDRQADLLVSLTDEVGVGFQTLHADNVKQFKETRRTRIELGNTLHEIQDIGVAQYQATNARFRELMTQEAGFHYDAIRQNAAFQDSMAVRLDAITQNQMVAYYQTVGQNPLGSGVRGAEIAAGIYGNPSVRSASLNNPTASFGVFNQGSKPIVYDYRPFQYPSLREGPMGREVRNYVGGLSQSAGGSGGVIRNSVGTVAGFANAKSPKQYLGTLARAANSNPADPIKVGGQQFTAACGALNSVANFGANHCKDLADVGEFVSYAYSGNYAGMADKLLNSSGDVGKVVNTVAQGAQDVVKGVFDAIGLSF